MIACVTFETSKIVEPALYYEINKIHIIRYIRDPDSETGRMYDEFRQTVCERLEAESPRPIEIVVHNVPVTHFADMLRTVLSIIRAEKSSDANEECDIFVNISAGTPEYSAASTVASMMIPGVTPFSVGTKEYTVSNEVVKQIYYVDGKPVGLSKTTYPPKAVPIYPISIPEEHLVRGLRVLYERSTSKKSITSGAMISALKDAGIWYRDPRTDDSGKKSSGRQTEAVYYQRDFIAKWVKNGWIRKDDLLNKYEVTLDGKNVIDTFYVDLDETSSE